MCLGLVSLYRFYKHIEQKDRLTNLIILSTKSETHWNIK